MEDVYIIDKKLCVQNQKNVKSCVAFAVTSVLEYLHNKRFSVGFLYGFRNIKTKKEQNPGLELKTTLTRLKKTGCVLEKDFNQNVEVPLIIQRFHKEQDRLLKLAIPYRIKDFIELEKIEDIKKHIKNECPVIFTVNTNNRLENGKLIIEGNEKHCLICIGYSKNGFILQNSYGKNWGDNGKCYLDFKEKFEECYGIINGGL